jgi:hypothetical protein
MAVDDEELVRILPNITLLGAARIRACSQALLCRKSGDKVKKK